MEYIGLLGIMVSLTLFVIMSLNGIPLTVSSVILSVVLWVFSLGCENAMGFDQMLSAFTSSAGVIIDKYLFILVFSALFGNIVAATGIASSLSGKLKGAIDHAPVKYSKYLAVCVVPFLNAIFVYTGISVFAIVFVVVFVARDLFKRLDIPWHLYALSSIGSNTFAASMLPGSLASVNVAPQTVLGTSLSSAPRLSLILAAEGVLLGVVYIIYSVKRCERSNEGFYPSGAEMEQVYLPSETGRTESVNLFIAVPSIFLPVMLIRVLNYSIAASLLITCLILLLVYRKRLAGKMKTTVVGGLTSGLMPVLTLALASGFAGVLVSTPGFSPIYALIDALNVPITVKMSILCCTMCFLLGNAVAAQTSSLQLIGVDRLSASGIGLGVYHRLAAVSSMLAVAPHNVGMCNSMAVTRLTYRNSYIHYFITGPVFGAIIMLTAILLVQIGVVS